MMGAIFSHLAFLGIAVKGDGGFLFFLALVLLCSISCLFARISNIGKLLKK